MMGPFLGVTLVPQTEVRNIMIPIFHDMMDWEQRKNGNFKQVTVTLLCYELQIVSRGGCRDKNGQLFSPSRKRLLHIFLAECVPVCVGGSGADGQAGEHGVGWERG